MILLQVSDTVDLASDLCEKFLKYCIEKFRKNLYLMQNKSADGFGLSRHTISVYEKAATTVLKGDK